MFVHLERLHLNGDQGHSAVKQGNDVQEPTGYVFDDQNRTMLILGIAFAFDVPVFNATDDMRLIGRAKLQFDLKTLIGIGVLQ